MIETWAQYTCDGCGVTEYTGAANETRKPGHNVGQIARPMEVAMRTLKLFRLIVQGLLAAWCLAMAMIGADKHLYIGMMWFAAGGVFLCIVTAIEATRLLGQPQQTE